jgi:hypothetical protein
MTRYGWGGRRTGARFAREKQVPRCARNDKQEKQVQVQVQVQKQMQMQMQMQMRGSFLFDFAQGQDDDV